MQYHREMSRFCICPRRRICVPRDLKVSKFNEILEHTTSNTVPPSPNRARKTELLTDSLGGAFGPEPESIADITNQIESSFDSCLWRKINFRSSGCCAAPCFSLAQRLQRLHVNGVHHRQEHGRQDRGYHPYVKVISDCRTKVGFCLPTFFVLFSRVVVTKRLFISFRVLQRGLTHPFRFFPIIGLSK